MGHFGVLCERGGDALLLRVHALMGGELPMEYPVPKDELAEFLKAGTFKGLVVTGAYKKAVLPYCHRLDPVAERLQSVDAITVDASGRLMGHNTAYYGFQQMVKRANVGVRGAKVLVLGTGGAAVAAAAVAEDMGAKSVVHVSRHSTVDYTSVYALHNDGEIIINATPVGCYPNNGGMPVRLSGFRRCRCVLDTVYDPLRTMLLLEAERRSIPCEGGLTMLAARAKMAQELFSGQEIPESRIGEACTQLMEEVCNIVLIGMPGSGKSFFGALIAKAFGRTLINMDDHIEEEQGMPPAQIILERGEPAFRDLEVEAARALGCKHGLVLSTGGGTVLRRESMDALRQNGCVFFVDRPLSELATDGRPLSQGNDALQRLYDARIGLYTGYADVNIMNTRGMDAEHIAQTVLREYEKVCAVASLPMWEQE